MLPAASMEIAPESRKDMREPFKLACTRIPLVSNGWKRGFPSVVFMMVLKTARPAADEPGKARLYFLPRIAAFDAFKGFFVPSEFLIASSAFKWASQSCSSALVFQ